MPGAGSGAAAPIVFHPDYTVPLPPGHRFPMGKFGRIKEVLVADGVVSAEALHRPEPASRAALELAHEPAYVAAVFGLALDADPERRLAGALSDALLRRSRAAVGGTVLAARLALEHGLACNTAGGSHHAFAGYGAGFCLFNDIAVATRLLQEERRVERVVVIDLDVHQGDGTADFFKDDARVFTFSVHCEANYPLRKQKSDLDVAVPAGTGDGVYLSVVRTHLAPILEKCRPDLAFYIAGVDPHGDDLLGKLALTDEGLRARDRHVIEACLDAGVPLACVVGGGYGNDLELLARRHSSVHRTACEIFAAR